MKLLEREKNDKIVKKVFDTLEKENIKYFLCAITEESPTAGFYFTHGNTITDRYAFFSGLCLAFHSFADFNGKKLSEVAKDFYNFSRKFERDVLPNVTKEEKVDEKS